jgi:hypothetical protein
MKWMSGDGDWIVELIQLTATNGRDGAWLRVTHHGIYIGEARDWDGVTRLGVDIGDLRETYRKRRVTRAASPGRRTRRGVTRRRKSGTSLALVAPQIPGVS